ncbi:MAG: hypothetical protein U0263_40680 [Polyangiaceae bacterium]
MGSPWCSAAASTWWSPSSTLFDPSLLDLVRAAASTREGPVCIAHALRPDAARSFGGLLHRVLAKPAEDQGAVRRGALGAASQA